MNQTYADRQKQVKDYLEKCKASKMSDGGIVGPSDIDPKIAAAIAANQSADAAGAPIQTGGTDQGYVPPVSTGSADAPQSNILSQVLNYLKTPKTDPTANTIGQQGPNPTTNFQGPATAPAIPAPTPTAGSPVAVASVPPVPPVQTSNKSPVSSAGTAETVPASDKPFQKLFDQDPSQLTQGLNPQDRQALAQDLLSRQRSGGNIVAEALAGIGDAIAARGGVNQDALGKLFRLESDQRKEALGNFDAARQAAVQNYTLKSQMGDNAIKQLAAQDAYGLADPNLAQQLGAPKGTLNKDLPLYLQIYSAKANQSIANGNQILSATKQASEENDNYNKTPGVFHAKQTPEERQVWITNRTNDLVAQSHGLVKVQQHGHVGYLSPQDYQKAKQGDPTVQQVSF